MTRGICPACGYWDGDHTPECVISRLRDLGVEGRQAHRRALLLVTLLTAGEGMTLTRLSDVTGVTLEDVRYIARTLFAEGLAYPDWSVAGRVHLTTAPHVQGACLAAADLLGLTLTQPLTPLSPLLGRAQ